MKLTPTSTLSVYLGDSAPLSGLQLLRAIVENAFGQCDFTTDPSRHKIMENIVELSTSNELPGVFPSIPASNALIESFFTNVRYRHAQNAFGC